MDRTFQRNPNVEAAPLNEDAILFDPTSSKFIMLNRTSSFIWERLSAPMTPEALAGELCTSFENVQMGEALDDVRATLDQMLSMNLILAGDAS